MNRRRFICVGSLWSTLLVAGCIDGSTEDRTTTPSVSSQYVDVPESIDHSLTVEYIREDERTITIDTSTTVSNEEAAPDDVDPEAVTVTVHAYGENVAENVYEDPSWGTALTDTFTAQVEQDDLFTVGAVADFTNAGSIQTTWVGNA